MPTPDFSKVWASNSPLPEYTFTDSDYLTGWDFVGSAPPTKNEFDAWFKMVDTKLNWLYGQLQDTASKMYPVGSVYISFNSTNPATLLGGTWTRLKDTFLLANGDTYSANSTGGSATKTIGISNLPAHNHSVNSAGTHNHTASTGASGVHNHTASTGASGIHNHTVSGSNSDAGKHTHTITTTCNTVDNHTHKRGSMNITGTFFADNIGASYNTGAFEYKGSTVTPGIVDNADAPSRVIDFDASRTWDGETTANGRHTHTITATASQVPNHTHTWSGTVANSTSHTHTVTINNSASHTHTVTVENNGSHTHTTNNTGSGTALNIMPPYTTVYMWRRTA